MDRINILMKNNDFNVLINIIEQDKPKNSTVYIYTLCIYPVEKIKKLRDRSTYCVNLELTEPIKPEHFDYNIIGEVVELKDKIVLSVFMPHFYSILESEGMKFSTIPDNWNKLRKLFDELKKEIGKFTADYVFLLAITSKVVDYGNAIDVWFEGSSVPIRLEDVDLLDPKYLERWFVQNFKRNVELSKQDYKILVQNWYSMAERKKIGDDPLSNTLIDEFVARLSSAFFYSDWTDEAKEKLIAGTGTPVVIVEKGENKVWIPSKFFVELKKLEKVPSKTGKIRDMFKDVVIKSDAQKEIRATVDGVKVAKNIKFWVFDYSKLIENFPTLGEKEIISGDGENGGSNAQ